MHPMIRNWIEEQGWADLRPMQQRVFDPIEDASSDVLVVAGTASGKTEAAFLPIFSAILSKPTSGGTRCLCVSPMKALINDQYDRLQRIGRYLGISVERWHGDVSATVKRRTREVPPEVLIITPESLESQLMRRGYELRERFGALSWVVIDEFHLFLGRQRGTQVESQLTRLSHLLGSRPVRIGLSATLGDSAEAERFLSSGSGRSPVVEADPGPPAKFQYEFVVPSGMDDDVGTEGEEAPQESLGSLADEVIERFPGGSYLVFANSKSTVEELTDEIRMRSGQFASSREFVCVPHHGSLSTDERHRAERLLSAADEPTIVVATSTLEVGIDIPAVGAVGQVGAPTAVATLRQRLGRSGRRGEPSNLHMFLATPAAISASTPTLDKLRTEVVQAVAVVELAEEGWAEPSQRAPGQWSTLIHQILSTVSERGGCSAGDLFAILIPDGQFADIEMAGFAELLRHLGSEELLCQAPHGALLLGRRGERLVATPDFCAVFETPVEFSIYFGSKELGSIAKAAWVRVGDPLIFAGRRWMIQAIDERRHTILVAPDSRKYVPKWHGSPQPVHREVRSRMSEIYEAGPRLQLGEAKPIVDDARYWYERLGVGVRPLIEDGPQTLILSFGGTIETETLAALLRSNGIDADECGVAVAIQRSRGGAPAASDIELALGGIVGRDRSAEELVKLLPARRRPKFHDLLPDSLQTAEDVQDSVDLDGAQYLAGRLLEVLGARAT